MEYRVENKYIISDFDMTVLSKRLEMVMQKDIHQTGNCYTIRSVYFRDKRKEEQFNKKNFL